MRLVLPLVALCLIGLVIHASAGNLPLEENASMALKECSAMWTLKDAQSVTEAEQAALARIDTYEAELKKNVAAETEAARLAFNDANADISKEVAADAQTVESLDKAGQKLNFSSDQSALEKAKSTFSGLTSAASGVSSGTKSLTFMERRREGERKLKEARLAYAHDNVALKAIPALKASIKECAADQRKYLQPQLPPPTPGAQATVTGTWNMTCDAWSPEKFTVSGQFVLDLMPANAVYRPLQGKLVGGGLDTMTMSGQMTSEGDISFYPAEGEKTANFVNFFGKVVGGDGTYAASGDINATYNGASCAGKFSS